MSELQERKSAAGALWAFVLLCLVPALGLGAISLILLAAGLKTGLFTTLLSAVGMCLALLFFLSPTLGGFSLAFLLPVFGNRPGSEQAVALTAFLLAFQIIFLLRLFSPSFRKGIAASFHRPEVLLYAALSAATLFSLTGYPLREFFLSIWSAAPRFTDLSALLWRAKSFLSAPETSIDYPLLATLFWWSGFFLFLTVSRYARSTFLLLGVLAGLLLTIAVGLGDYFGLLSLASFRALDPVVNPGGEQFRIQSFFGHSGWLAEYVTLAIPSALVLLGWKAAFWKRVLTLLLLLLVGEFVLILSYQRGGWISYPLTLLVVWAAIYVQRLFEKGERNIPRALRLSAVKIAVSLPLTVLLSVGLLSVLEGSFFADRDDRFSLASYASRLEDITKVSDRTGFMRAGFLMGKEAPFFGLGTESFAVQYERLFAHPGDKYFGAFTHPLHGSAHNVYFQTFAGKGGVGLALLVSLVAFIAWQALRRALLPGGETPERLALLSAFAFCGAFFIYGNVQEVFYISALLVLCALFLGIGAREINSRPRSNLSNTPYLLFFGFFAFGLLLQLFWRPGYEMMVTLKSEAAGCFAPESGTTDGKTTTSFFWCGPRGFFVPEARLAAAGSGEPFSFRVRAGGNIQPEESLLRFINENGEVLFQTKLRPGEEKVVRLPEERWNLPVWFETAGYFIPARDLPASNDARALSFQVLPNPENFS